MSKKILKSLLLMLLVLIVLPQNISAKDNNTKSNVVTVNNNNAMRGENIDDWMPDKELRKGVFEELHNKGVIESEHEITKDLVANELDWIIIKDEVKDLKGLEFALQLYGVSFEFKDKKLNDYDLSVFANHPNKDNLMLSPSTWDSAFIYEGNLAQGLAQIIEYKLNFTYEVFSMEAHIQITKGNYKSFDLNIKEYYKSFSDHKDLSFDDTVTYEIDGKVLIYKLDYNKDKDNLNFTLDEDSSDDVSFEDIKANGNELKSQGHLSLVDSYLAENNPVENMNLGYFFFFPILVPEEAENVIVKYLDENSNKLHDDIVLKGDLGEKYTSESKHFNGYTLSKVPENASGTYTVEKQVVIYRYNKNSIASKAAPVLVNYIDMQGRELQPSITLNGELNEFYNTDAKKIKGYRLKEEPKNKKGYFTESKQVVVYRYDKINKSTIAKAGNNYIAIFGLLSISCLALITLKKYKNN